MPATHYDTLTEARNHFKDLLDAAESGRPASVRREGFRGVVLDGERLRHFLSTLLPVSAEMVAEAGGWSIFLPGLPLAADGATPDEAVDEMVDVLREYAEDWADHLLHAPNHKDNWGLVQFIALSSEAQLKGWLTGQ
jgi:predicted RNase H-like HicB family nuclease